MASTRARLESTICNTSAMCRARIFPGAHRFLRRSFAARSGAKLRQYARRTAAWKVQKAREILRLRWSYQAGRPLQKRGQNFSVRLCRVGLWERVLVKSGGAVGCVVQRRRFEFAADARKRLRVSLLQESDQFLANKHLKVRSIARVHGVHECADLHGPVI